MNSRKLKVKCGCAEQAVKQTLFSDYPQTWASWQLNAGNVNVRKFGRGKRCCPECRTESGLNTTEFHRLLKAPTATSQQTRPTDSDSISNLFLHFYPDPTNQWEKEKNKYKKKEEKPTTKITLSHPKAREGKARGFPNSQRTALQQVWANVPALRAPWSPRFGAGGWGQGGGAPLGRARAARRGRCAPCRPRRDSELGLRRTAVWKCRCHRRACRSCPLRLRGARKKGLFFSGTFLFLPRKNVGVGCRFLSSSVT